MKAFLFVSLLFVIACGKHSTDNFGYTKKVIAAEGDKPETPADFMKLAIDQKDLPAFQKLLDDGIDVNVVLKEGSTPLIYATLADNAKFVYMLIQKGADLTLVDANGKTALDHALAQKRDRIALLLDPPKMAEFQNELFAGVLDENVDIVNAKLLAGTDPNFLHESGESPLTQAVLLKSIGLVRTIAKWKDTDLGVTMTDVNLPNANGQKPLAIALEKKFTAIANELKKLNAQE